MSRMFEFIDECWNPLAGGPCPHGCIYCWAQGKKGLVKRHNMKKYQGPFRLVEKELKRWFKPGSFVFVQDMSDLFARNVPDQIIKVVLDRIEKFPETKFLLLTKNPKRYADFYLCMPKNVILGVTIETDHCIFDTPSRYKSYPEISKSPFPAKRIIDTAILHEYLERSFFISIEPILDFRPPFLIEAVRAIRPDFVAIGYDNYDHRLPEPPLEKTLRLIEELEKFTTVYRKTLRKAWWEREGE